MSDDVNPGAAGDGRDGHLRGALWVSWFSVVWSVVVGALALTSGFAAGSLALVEFGLDSAIDSSAPVVLVWRFRVEGLRPPRRPGGVGRGRVVGVTPSPGAAVPPSGCRRGR